MQRCFQLARLGRQHAKPNPMVGAVLVHNERIIGEGYHERFGLAHAEVNCIQSVSLLDQHLIPQSTLYVSLEPCIHFGKTPPCADLVIKSQIKTVVVACSDPFNQVNGGGIKKLQDAGVNVITPFLEQEAVDLNKRFFTFHTQQRPYIILKWAQSNNGKIASNGRRYQISNNLTNALVHKWRSEEGAILVGTNTVVIDNPTLTTRHWPGGNPLRLVVDLKLRIAQDSVMFSDEQPLVIFNGMVNKKEGNKLFLKCSKENVLKEIMTYLHSQKITSLIVEGGSKLLQSFIDVGLWDEARIITNKGLEIPKGVDAPVLRDGSQKGLFHLAGDQLQVLTNRVIR